MYIKKTKPIFESIRFLYCDVIFMMVKCGLEILITALLYIKLQQILDYNKKTLN